MGIILYCNNKKICISYKIFNKIKNYLGIISINYLNKLTEQNNDLNNNLNTIINNSNSSFNSLLNNQNSIFFLNNLLLFFENNFENINKLQLQGIYSFIKQTQLSYSYTYNESNTFINSINVIKNILDSEINPEMNEYVNNIYNIHKYSVDNQFPLNID
jgi:hypothetical protein